MTKHKRIIDGFNIGWQIERRRAEIENKKRKKKKKNRKVGIEGKRQRKKEKKERRGVYCYSGITVLACTTNVHWAV